MHRVDTVWLFAKHFLKLGNGLVHLAFLVQLRAFDNRRSLRVVLDVFPQCLVSFIAAARGDQRMSQLSLRQWQCRLQANCCLERGDCLVKPRLHGHDTAEIFVQLRKLRLHVQRKAQLFLSLGQSILFHESLRQQPYVVGIPGMLRQEIAAYFFCTQRPLPPEKINCSIDAGALRGQRLVHLSHRYSVGAPAGSFSAGT